MAHKFAVLPPLVLCLVAPAVATAQDKPRCVVEIVRPAAEAEVTGTIDVEVKITALHGAKLPTSAFIGLGGAPWFPMVIPGAAGEWKAKVDTTMVPNGEHVLTVVTENKRVKAARAWPTG